MQNRGIVLLVCALCIGSPSGWAADEATPESRIPTVTRWVKLFTELESSLAASIKAGDEAGLQKLLADDFELRTGSMPASPTPRAEWIRSLLLRHDVAYSIEQMAVHDLGNHAVVSFVEKSASGSEAKVAPNIFVVDVWKRSGNDWKLAIRYASATSRDLVVPGAATEPPAIPKKY
jgi:hypothetical protein